MTRADLIAELRKQAATKWLTYVSPEIGALVTESADQLEKVDDIVPELQQILLDLTSHRRATAAERIRKLIESLGSTAEGVCTICGRGAQPGTTRCGYHSGHFNRKGS